MVLYMILGPQNFQVYLKKQEVPGHTRPLESLMVLVDTHLEVAVQDVWTYSPVLYSSHHSDMVYWNVIVALVLPQVLVGSFPWLSARECPSDSARMLCPKIEREKSFILQGSSESDTYTFTSSDKVFRTLKSLPIHVILITVSCKELSKFNGLPVLHHGKLIITQGQFRVLQNTLFLHI
jgi:hypothetical protein